ncbi:hypothetical protein IAE22_31795, partial [Bacillus sp. S34]|nr:hypothetical protein [Bacillus sp. S34]
DQNQSATGNLWVRLGAATDAAFAQTSEAAWDTVDTPLQGTSRQFFGVADTVSIPEGMRGRKVAAMLMARRASTTTASEAIVLDADDTTLWTYDMEVADMHFVFDPARQDEWVQDERFAATPSMVGFVNRASAMGFT